MNEALFFIHLLLIFAFAWGALKLGKGALTVWVAIQALLANLFVLKQIELFGWNATCSDVFAIGSILGLNILQEYFGKEASQKAIRICFYYLCFFALMSQIHLHYLPSKHDAAQGAFDILLSPAPRLLLASLTTFFLVQQLDLSFFAFLKTRLKNSSFAVRNALSLFFSQLTDTLLFSFLGLYGLLHSLWEIILISFILKFAIIFCLTPLALFAKRALKSYD